MPRPDILLRSKLRLGKELISAKRFAEARLVYQEICARLKTDADSWFTLGAINGMLRRHDEAVTCCSKAVELSPRHVAAWYNLGIALRDSGQPEKSVVALRKTLQLDPKYGNAEFYAVYGSSMQTMGRYEAAINAYRKAIDMRHPETAEIHENVAAALCMQGKYRESIEHFELAL